MDNLIFQRTSVRNYTSEKISNEHLQMLLKAAMAAPSAKNMQPWEFVVVQDRHMLDRIRDFHLYASMLKEAPLAIVVCGDKSKVAVEEHEFWQQDCAAATQNILLEATELGLGAVWLGIYPSEPYIQKLQQLLELPEDIIPFSIVSVGHPAGEIHPKNKFSDMKIHWEKWKGEKI